MLYSLEWEAEGHRFCFLELSRLLCPCVCAEKFTVTLGSDLLFIASIRVTINCFRVSLAQNLWRAFCGILRSMICLGLRTLFVRPSFFLLALTSRRDCFRDGRVVIVHGEAPIMSQIRAPVLSLSLGACRIFRHFVMVISRKVHRIF